MRLIRRSLTISLLITGHLLALLFRWIALRITRAPVARRQALFGSALARLCRRLGATFVKLAQVLATRADILSDPAREELSKLHDQVGAFPYRLARETIIEELGEPPERLFEQFDPYPVASASVAQVHKATLRSPPGDDGSSSDGREVAVKVLRPQIEELVDIDLRVMRTWAHVLAILPPFSSLNPVCVLEEFAHAIWRQLDLRLEARNNRRFAENFAADEHITFPTLVDEFCTRRVLCMEYVEGHGVLETDTAETSIVERAMLARRGYAMILRMVFEHGFVHADLHPGNLRVRGDQLVLFDLGLTAEVTPEHRQALIGLCLAWVQRDVDAACARIAEVGFHGQEPRDRERLRRDVVELLERYGDVALGEIQVGRLLLDALSLVRRQWADFDPSFTMVALSIAVVEGVARQLAPDLRLMQEALPILQELWGGDSAADV